MDEMKRIEHVVLERKVNAKRLGQARLEGEPAQVQRWHDDSSYLLLLFLDLACLALIEAQDRNPSGCRRPKMDKIDIAK